MPKSKQHEGPALPKIEGETRDAKLSRYQKAHRTLLSEIEELKKLKAPLENQINRKNKKLHRIGQAIYDMKHDGDTPEITDHAMIRYLERVEGRDIKELKILVAKDKNAVKIGNVIVTVNEELENES